MWFKKPVTGVTVSPTGEFMCTSHHGRVALSVWADQRCRGSRLALKDKRVIPCGLLTHSQNLTRSLHNLNYSVTLTLYEEDS